MVSFSTAKKGSLNPSLFPLSDSDLISSSSLSFLVLGALGLALESLLSLYLKSFSFMILAVFLPIFVEELATLLV